MPWACRYGHWNTMAAHKCQKCHGTKSVRPLAIDDTIRPEHCLLEAMLKQEMEKPPHLRQRNFSVCCQCSRCLERGGRL
jgi:hypothetical protein